MNRLGHFSEDGKEYFIDALKVPRPLMNYLWNPRLLSGVNHFGGGDGAYCGRTASYIDPDGKGRCSLFRNGNRYFYIRDDQTGEFWNPGWYPVRRDLDDYRCTHGLGYTIIESLYKGIRSKARVFVNESDPVEIWTLTVANETKERKDIKVYSFVDYSLEGYVPYSDYNSYVYSELHKKHNMLVSYNKAQERPHEYHNGFAASSLELSGFDSSRSSFLGAYGDISAPESVVKGKCKNSISACEWMAGVLENSFVLYPGETVSFHVLFGAASSGKEAQKMTEKLFAQGKIESDFKRLIQSKNKMTDNIVVRTGNEKIDKLTNSWLKQQVQLCSEAGRGTGKGFRDQLQDAWAVASFNPELAREKILETLRYEYSDGRCVRGWLPLDPHIYSDGPVWIAPAVNAYIKETGDKDFLKDKAPYLDKGEDSVWGHILTAVRYSSDDLGERGLVLAHDGDWNDSLNGIGTGGKGESVWTSIALYYALNQTAEMARELLNDSGIENEMLERARRIKDSVNNEGWDGEWYLAAYNDSGEKVGSHMEKEGSIYLNSQTWAVMSGVALGDRAEKCLKAVDELLDSPYGPLTLHPTYTKYNPGIGRLTGFVPGIWENGTPYCHGGTFKIVADCCAGRGNEAVRTLLKILPDSELNPSYHSGCEPYALTNMYFGPDNPRRGQTMFAWVTGSAGWMFRAITQYIMGFHPEYDSVTIRPCIPEDWENCGMKRVFRNDTYLVKIVNPNQSRNKVKRITVDGAEIPGDTFKVFGDGKSHSVIVEMG